MSDESTKIDRLKLLREPFQKHHISLLPKPFKKDSAKSNCNVCGGFHGMPAAHLEYVGHAALTHRLLDVDPEWSWEPLAKNDLGLPLFDKEGGLWINLTVCGVTRLGYGNAESSQYKEIGSREKEVIGDALRNAAMRFGAALDLWHKGDLHADGPKKPEAAGNIPQIGEASGKLTGTQAVSNRPTPTPKKLQEPTRVNVMTTAKPSEAQIKRLFSLSGAAGWTQDQVKAFISITFKLTSTKDMNIEQYNQTCDILEKKYPYDQVMFDSQSGPR
jgi:hypothetical protein